MQEDNEQYIAQLETALQQEQSKYNSLAQGASSAFAPSDSGNLIEFQLELDDILERIDHLLRGHILKTDEKGNQRWVETKDDNLKPFNEYGVQMLMNIMTFMLNRNTILSNHKENRINEICYDFGSYLKDSIFMEYEKMGMNTHDKMKKYQMIVLLLTLTIENAYLRSLHGGERQSLREGRSVVQSQNLQGNLPDMSPSYNPTKPKGGFISRWINT